MPQLVLDANMNVVFVVGSVDSNLLGVAKRVKEYRPEDYYLLYEHIRRFAEIVLLPNTLTEASTLLSQIKGAARDDCLPLLSALTQGNERYIRSAVAAAEPIFPDLGLTDAAILCALETDVHLLTADYDPYLAALQRIRDAQYFEHLRG